MKRYARGLRGCVTEVISENIHTFRNNDDDVFFALFQKQLDAMKGFQNESFDKYELDHIGTFTELKIFMSKLSCFTTFSES